ncbi:MAG TPA: Hsp20/alpha crystallin family protein [Polyangiaceae bacterium]|jgi:HSP20 family molecular chaperone IbpA|nr:Hsp20/alpha crystallin family protein [Polyangiaceae bacterium]
MDKLAQEETRPVRELAPNVDIFENDNELLVVADVPGLDSNEIGVHVDLPEFRIEAKVQGSPDRPVVYTRTFRVDERIDPERVKAEYKDGVLRVHLAKSAAFRPRRVEVQTS